MYKVNAKPKQRHYKVHKKKSYGRFCGNGTTGIHMTKGYRGLFVKLKEIVNG